MAKPKDSTPAPSAPRKGFDERLAELDRIVLEIESGDLSLEESLARYQAGMQLQRELAREIEQHRRRLQELAADGTLAPHPADAEAGGRSGASSTAGEGSAAG